MIGSRKLVDYVIESKRECFYVFSTFLFYMHVGSLYDNAAFF